MAICKHFNEFIELLNDFNVQYLIVGGYAVAFHGHPRYTKDIDIWIFPEEENIKAVIRVLQDFGFGSLGIMAKDFKNPDQIIQLGYPPNRIDLLTELEGVDFLTCYDKKDVIEIDGIRIAFIDLESLKQNKKSLHLFTTIFSISFVTLHNLKICQWERNKAENGINNCEVCKKHGSPGYT